MQKMRTTFSFFVFINVVHIMQIIYIYYHFEKCNNWEFLDY